MCIPFKVDIVYISPKNRPDKFLAFHILGFSDSLSIIDKTTMVKFRKVFDKIRNNESNNFQAHFKDFSRVLRRIYVNRFSVQMTYSDDVNAALFYPLIAIISTFVSQCGERGIMTAAKGSRYCQIVLTTQWNLHLILSAAMQILRLSRG